MTEINRDRLAELVARERALYVQLHSRSAAHYSDARNLFGRVPMTWMNKWPGGFAYKSVIEALMGLKKIRYCGTGWNKYLDRV